MRYKTPDVRFICIKSVNGSYNNNRVNDDEPCPYKDENGVCLDCEGLRVLPCKDDYAPKQKKIRSILKIDKDAVKQNMFREHPEFLEID